MSEEAIVLIVIWGGLILAVITAFIYLDKSDNRTKEVLEDVIKALKEIELKESKEQ